VVRREQERAVAAQDDDDADADAPAPPENLPEPSGTRAAEKSAEPAASVPEKSPDPKTLAMLQPAPTAAPTPAPPPPAPAPPVRKLDPEEINLLLKQGEQFIATGDLATARIVLQRAAEAGDATAAVALGATYDPGVLAKLGVVGMGAADVEKARNWYQKAESLGSPEGARRLQMLATRAR
jgi:TPR repeat protein